MTSVRTQWQPTARDRDVLSTFDLLPLTPAQLLLWSERFAEPFSNITVLQRRLRRLTEAGLLRRWRLAIENDGATPFYYRLSPEGKRYLYGKDDDHLPHRKRAFAPIGSSLHAHTMALSTFIVTCGVAAHRLGAEFADLYAENAYTIANGKDTLRLDFRFSLILGSLRRNYNVELDNSSETLLSSRAKDSIARKIRILDADDAQYESRDSRRAITLFVTTKSKQRMENILDTASTIVRNSERSLIYGAYLPELLEQECPLTTACFADHRGRGVALLSQTRLQHHVIPAPSIAVPALI